jgi:signal transduction histidine kinase
MAGGDLSARTEPRGSTEQMEVAGAFNEMADRLGAVLVSQREFVADASHQLRTPLTGLRLRLEAAGLKAGPEAGRELAAAERETERLASVVGDLLALAASEEPAEPQTGELRSAATAAAGRWSDAAAEDGHELLLSGGGAIEVRAGERDLAVILDNLLENAIKYSPRDSRVEIGWSEDGDTAALTVASPGRPLSDEERERAFERFYRGQSSRRAQGTGLGLPIVASLARRAGGSAGLENGDGRVVARILLPRAQ